MARTASGGGFRVGARRMKVVQGESSEFDKVVALGYSTRVLVSEPSIRWRISGADRSGLACGGGCGLETVGAYSPSLISSLPGRVIVGHVSLAATRPMGAGNSEAISLIAPWTPIGPGLQRVPRVGLHATRRRFPHPPLPRACSLHETVKRVPRTATTQGPACTSYTWPSRREATSEVSWPCSSFIRMTFSRRASHDFCRWREGHAGAIAESNVRGRRSIDREAVALLQLSSELQAG